MTTLRHRQTTGHEDKRGRILPLDQFERDYIYEYNDKNLTTTTNEVVKHLSDFLDRNPETIRAFLWREGIRPREYERMKHYINNIGTQVSRDCGFYVSDKKPCFSKEGERIIRKLWHQRMVESLYAYLSVQTQRIK